jgi:hypothetical protein
VGHRIQEAHAVENGILRYLSVSQLKKFRRCRRAWFFSKVLRVPEPPRKSQKTGIEGHRQLEHYLTTGENVLGKVAATGLHLLPEPGDGLLVEQRFDWSLAGVPVTGFIDLVNLRRLDQGVVRVTDHKFTSDIARWGASASDLATTEHEAGVQMIGYGAALAARFPEVERFELEHLYFQTRKPRAVPVLTGASRDQVLAEWAELEPVAAEMRATATAERLQDVKPSWGACDAFGGCAFRAQCHERAAFTLTNPGATQMSLMQMIQNPAAAAPTATSQGISSAPPLSEATELPFVPKKLRVFVDAVPNGGAAEPLAPYVARHVDAIQAEIGVPDLRLGGHDSPLAFGRWKGVLASAIRGAPPTPGDYVALGVMGSELMQVAIEALEPLCAPGDFIRGVS